MRLPLALLLLAAMPAWAASETATRLVVADHSASTVTVLAEDGAALLRLETGEPVRLHHGAHHGQVTLRAPNAGQVRFLETGLHGEGHGDHADITIAPPSLLGATLTGARPFHIIGGDGRVAIFFDGDGTAAILRAGAESEPPAILRTSHAHHGAAVPYAGPAAPMVALSDVTGAGERPSIVTLRNDTGEVLARRDDCPRLHGESRTGPLIAFGCADGVLLLDTRSGAFSKIANPGGAGDRMVRNLEGGQDWRLLLGDFGPEAMVVVDPDATAMRVIPLPARRLHFALDAERADTGFAITEDGMLHAFNTLDGTPRASVQATGRYSLEGGSAVARPRLSAGGGIVAVTDPAAGRVVVFDARTLEQRRVLAPGGAPFDIRVVSVTGERH
jgi:hypothetical protein